MLHRYRVYSGLEIPQKLRDKFSLDFCVLDHGILGEFNWDIVWDNVISWHNCFRDARVTCLALNFKYYVAGD